MSTHEKSVLLHLAERKDDLIGRTLYSYEGQHVSAGPISDIFIEDVDLLIIKTEWTAVKHEDASDETWREDATSVNRISVRDNFGYAHFNTDGSVRLSIPYIGSARIVGPSEPAFARPR